MLLLSAMDGRAADLDDGILAGLLVAVERSSQLSSKSSAEGAGSCSSDASGIAQLDLRLPLIRTEANSQQIIPNSTSLSMRTHA